MPKHKHYDAIVAFAEGKPIQWRDAALHTEWFDLDNSRSIAWLPDCEYRVKPSDRLTKDELCRVFHSSDACPAGQLLAVAEAAIQHYIKINKENS